LWKIDISGRKWPITLIDEGTEPRKSGVYFLDKRPRSFDNDYRQVASLTKARWLTLRCSELARRCREKGSGVEEAKWEGSRENLGRTPKIKLETGNEAWYRFDGVARDVEQKIKKSQGRSVWITNVSPPQNLWLVALNEHTKERMWWREER
jgi:hypothetical protein